MEIVVYSVYFFMLFFEPFDERFKRPFKRAQSTDFILNTFLSEIKLKN
jgi:hypothetical protein